MHRCQCRGWVNQFAGVRIFPNARHETLYGRTGFGTMWFTRSSPSPNEKKKKKIERNTITTFSAVTNRIASAWWWGGRDCRETWVRLYIFTMYIGTYMKSNGKHVPKVLKWIVFYTLFSYYSNRVSWKKRRPRWIWCSRLKGKRNDKCYRKLLT